MKKYLVIASYSSTCLDDFEDVSNSSWKVGEVDTKEEVVELVKKEFKDYIEEQVISRFDVDDEIDNETKEEIENYKNTFETSIFSKFESWPEKVNMLEVGELYYVSDSYVEDLKCFVIELGD